jgi:uncharacterized protein YpmB
MNFRNKLLTIIVPIIILSVAAVSFTAYRQGARAVMEGQEQLMQKTVTGTGA